MLMITGSVAFAAEVAPVEDNEISLEYQEYYDNQDYYNNLAKNGYTLYVHVGPEYDEWEMERITEKSTGSEDCLVQSDPYTRELTIPTYYYDMLERGKKVISGSTTTTLGYLFTNYIYHGCSSFEISLYNRGDDTLEVDLVQEGSSVAFESYDIPAETTVIKYTTEDYWYGRFKNPCSVYGYVARDI